MPLPCSDNINARTHAHTHTILNPLSSEAERRTHNPEVRRIKTPRRYFTICVL